MFENDIKLDATGSSSSYQFSTTSVPHPHHIELSTPAEVKERSAINNNSLKLSNYDQTAICFIGIVHTTSG